MKQYERVAELTLAGMHYRDIAGLLGLKPLAVAQAKRYARRVGLIPPHKHTERFEILLKRDVIAALRNECLVRRYGSRPDEMITRLLTIIARDDLFDAILGEPDDT